MRNAENNAERNANAGMTRTMPASFGLRNLERFTLLSSHGVRKEAQECRKNICLQPCVASQQQDAGPRRHP
jgi:hypothetical protein